MAVQEIWFGGIILVLLGLVAYFIPIGDEGFTAPQIHQICSNDWVQFGLMFDTEGNLRQLCNTFSIITTAIYGLVVVGIVLFIVGALKKGKPEYKKQPGGYICEHCNFIGKTEVELLDHYTDAHPNSKKW